ARAVADRARDVQELLDAAAARVGDELGRVARVVALQDLEHAARVLQRVVGFRRVAVREPAAVASMRLLALHARSLEALFALAGRSVHRYACVLPRRHVVLALIRVP